MNVYMAPEAEVIEVSLNATILTTSNTGELGGDDPQGTGSGWEGEGKKF